MSVHRPWFDLYPLRPPPPYQLPTWSGPRVPAIQEESAARAAFRASAEAREEALAEKPKPDWYDRALPWLLAGYMVAAALALLAGVVVSVLWIASVYSSPVCA